MVAADDATDATNPGGRREPFWYDDNGLEMTFVENMKMLRERRGMSQTELAKRANARGLGFHQPTIQRIERGERPVKLGEAIALAEILGSTLELMMKDTSLSFAYEHLVAQMTSCWEAVQPDDGQTFPMARSIRWHVNELEDAIEDYKAAAKRFGVEQQPDIVPLAMTVHETLEAGLSRIEAARQEAQEVWSKLAVPTDVVPATFHSATAYAESQRDDD